MNKGSAFIYLIILDNLTSGKHNTRNMKMADLEFCMDRIKDDSGARSYRNAISSPRLSIPHWEKTGLASSSLKCGPISNQSPRPDDKYVQDAKARQGHGVELERHEVLC